MGSPEARPSASCEPTLVAVRLYHRRNNARDLNVVLMASNLSSPHFQDFKVEYRLLVRRCRRRPRLKQEAKMDPEEALVDSRNRLQSVLFGGTTASAWIADGVLTTRQGEEFLLESVVDGRLVSVRITSFIGPFMTSLRALLERTAAEDTCTGRCPLVTES